MKIIPQIFAMMVWMPSMVAAAIPIDGGHGMDGASLTKALEWFADGAK